MADDQPSKGWREAERRAVPEHGGLTLTLPGGIPVFFRKIPASGPKGFRMGSRGIHGAEEPAHRVVIPEDFYLGAFPVTQEQFGAWTGTVAYREWFEENQELIRKTSYNDKVESHKNAFAGNRRLPAENVTWWEAEAFARWLRSVETSGRFPAGHHAGLPCEAEWEYACRAGTDTEYGWGDGEAALTEAGWFAANSENRTHPVGEKAINGFGLYDVHGNVWEWCADVWDGDAYRRRPHGWSARAWTLEEAGKNAEFVGESGHPLRVFRGGSWVNAAWWCRSAYRGRWRPGYRDWYLGFRLLLAPVPGGSPGQTSKPSGAERGAGAGSDRRERKAQAPRAAEDEFFGAKLPHAPDEPPP